MSEVKKTVSDIRGLMNIKNEVEHKDVGRASKIKSGVESGVKNTEWLLRMKRGPLTTMDLALDLAADSEYVYKFRLLTVHEELEIADKLDELKLPAGHVKFRIMKICYTLSYATREIPSLVILRNPELTVQQLLYLDTETLFALGYKYDEFVMKYSPRLESLTQEQVSYVIQSLTECEDDIKKSELIYTLSLKQMHDLLLDLHKRYDHCIEQADRVVTGQLSKNTEKSKVTSKKANK